MRASAAHSAGYLRAHQCKKNLLEGLTVTILTSLLGTKVLGLVIFMWQAATPATSPAAVDHFSLMTMIKSMGPVAIGVVIVLLIMSVYSIAIMVERYLTYTAAKKQSVAT